MLYGKSQGQRTTNYMKWARLHEPCKSSTPTRVRNGLICWLKIFAVCYMCKWMNNWVISLFSSLHNRFIHNLNYHHVLISMWSITWGHSSLLLYIRMAKVIGVVVLVVAPLILTQLTTDYTHSRHQCNSCKGLRPQHNPSDKWGFDHPPLVDRSHTTRLEHVRIPIDSCH